MELGATFAGHKSHTHTHPPTEARPCKQNPPHFPPEAAANAAQMFAATVPRRGPFHRRGDNRGCPASPSPAGAATTQGCPELGETGGGGPGSRSPPLLLPHRGSPSPSRPVATTAGLTAGPGTGRATGSSATSAGERAGVGGGRNGDGATEEPGLAFPVRRRSPRPASRRHRRGRCQSLASASCRPGPRWQHRGSPTV